MNTGAGQSIAVAIWLLTTIAAVPISSAVDEQRFVENKDFNGQQAVIDASRSWHVTDDGLKRLRSYVLRGEVDIYMQNQVRVLNLAGTAITDAGLKHLEGADGLTQLEELTLADTQISDAGLKSLASLQQLKRLELGRTLVFSGGRTGPRVTEAGIKQLRRALPACRIEHQTVQLELSDTQLTRIKLWLQIGEPRLGEHGEITGLRIRPATSLTRQHRQSLPQLQHLTELHVSGVFSADDLATLNMSSGLRQLCLRDCRIENSATGSLAGLTELRVLDLSGARVTDDGLVTLGSLSKLTALDLRATEVRTRGLQQLRKLLPKTEVVIDPWRVVGLPYRRLTLNANFELHDVGSVGYRASRDQLTRELTRLLDHPSLERLNLRHSALTDDELEIVSRMPNLKELDVGNTKITSAGVLHLSKLKQLEKLNLWHTKITGDGGLSHLENLTQLRSLELDETGITDDALPSLARMERLQYTELWHTRVTRNGVKQLQQSLPELEIKANPRR